MPLVGRLFGYIEQLLNTLSPSGIGLHLFDRVLIGAYLFVLRVDIYVHIWFLCGFREYYKILLELLK